MADYCCRRMADDLNQTCAQHANRRDCPDALIDRARGGYGIIVHDGGASVVEIAFCPWCGTKLPPIGDFTLHDELRARLGAVTNRGEGVGPD